MTKKWEVEIEGKKYFVEETFENLVKRLVKYLKEKKKK